ncbi:hypothetical protein HYPSUDRAFT_205740 [Hypholoma sublateritium FD-334 SS-4]|uniref:Uncharacterized protein n=1 Tax=Hypholoma sublateritium (strain FD-334 SS-4) TaxID=945553 RepID=A0A0D2NMQ5_HYPSF|nr:hypothetical protein HYPSUDRAFT_205740 [Hypholoma sublateritium FD-334 SS-4]
MVNPGGFSGLRKNFLDNEQATYNVAVEAKRAADTLADIQRRYFKRFPVTLSHNEDPTDDFLASVDDDAPDPELTPPNRANMDSDDAYDRAKRVYELQIIEIKMRKAQIKRRLHYNYSKTKNVKATFEMGSNDPMAILMSKLTGNSLQRPRLKTPYNLWGPSNRCFVDPVFAERVKEGNVPAKGQAALRSSIYKELFEELPEDERREWVERAEREHQQALDKADAALKSGPSTAPEDRQRIIECLPKFFQPILDMVAEHTGWTATLITGGPEPADGGRLNVVSVHAAQVATQPWLHAGATSGAVKMNFGRCERASYSDVVLPLFGKFLRKCYSVQECRDRTLHDSSAFAGLAEIGNQEGFDVHRLDDRPREGDGFIRMVAPGQTPSIGIRATSSSMRKSSSTSAQPSASAAIARSTPQHKKADKSALTIPATIKFGPPKGRRRDSMADGSLGEGGPSHVLGEAQTGDLGPAAAPSVGCASRGPTPPTSRPSTPIPTVAVDTPSLKCSVAPAPPAPIDPSSTDMDNAPSPAPTPVQRATSTQPTPPTPIAAAPSVARAQSAMPFVGTVLKLRCRDDAVPSTATAFNAAPLTGAALATPPAVPPIQQGTRSTSPDAVGPSFPHTPEMHQPPAADSTLTPHPRHLVGSIAVPDLEQDAQVEVWKGNHKRKRGADSLPAAKRRKTSNEGPTPSTSGAADTASVDGVGARPSWVVNALNLLRSTPLGPEWDALVRSWLQFEQSEGFKDGRKLGSRHRPRIVADWIQRARTPKFRPEIKNADKFIDEFDTWWRTLQPAWRLDSASDLLTRDGDDWGCLRCSGVNGLLSVLAALFFWGCHAQSGAATFKSRWLEALEDVSYAITNLI